MVSLKYKRVIIHFISVLVVILFISATAKFSGSPGAKSGSPGDNNDNCTFCHSDNAAINKDNLISSNIPASGYVPGEMYIITVSAGHAGSDRIGFEITAENNAAEKMGTFSLINSERTTFTNNNSAVTHTAIGTIASNNEISWQLNWQAPEQGLGDVVFYVAANATNSDLSSSGDQVYLSNLRIFEEGTTGQENITFNQEHLQVYPNPVQNKLSISINENIHINNISLINLFGKKINFYEIAEDKNHTLTLNLNELRSGIYFLVLKTDNKTITRKIYKL